MQDIEKIILGNKVIMEESQDKKIEKREWENKENDIDIYGNREGWYNKQKKIIINPRDKYWKKNTGGIVTPVDGRTGTENNTAY